MLLKIKPVEIWIVLSNLQSCCSQFYCVLCSIDRSLYYPNYMLLSHLSIFSLLLSKINLRCGVNLTRLTGTVVSLSHFDQTPEEIIVHLHKRYYCLCLNFVFFFLKICYPKINSIGRNVLLKHDCPTCSRAWVKLIPIEIIKVSVI